jgi:hypothetical protein
MKQGATVFVSIPRTPVTVAAGLVNLNRRQVQLLRRSTFEDAPCWVVHPPLITRLRQAAEDEDGRALAPGHTIELRGLPEAWMTSQAPRSARSRFTPEVSEIIELLYPDTVTEAIGELVGMPATRVYAYAHARGWKKTPEFVRETARARAARPDHPMRQHQFPKGHVPANKGSKGINYPGMVATQFKKGTRPHTCMPIGSYRICEGALQRKLNDDPGPNNVRWAPVHRLVWEQAHGPVPTGCIVRFKPGQHTTVLAEITLERIECVTLAENMRRNSFRSNYPPEMVQLIQTRGHMNRMINKRQRQLAEEKP